LRGHGRRLAFWALALADFFRRRVRRFPFQAGWQPRLDNEQLVDSHWPMRSRVQNRLQDLAFRIRFIARQGVLWTLKRLASRALGFITWLVLLPATVVLYLLGYRHVTIFTDRVGHFALEPDCLLKEQALGRIAPRRWILLAPEAQVSNEHLLTYWAPYFRVVRGELACFVVRSMSGAGLMRFDASRYIRNLDKAQEAYRIEAEWGERPALLKLTAADEVWGSEMLGQLGLPPDAWFACVHAREGGFSPGDEEVHGHRNGRIENLVPAMEEIVRRGGWVLRLGDATMRPLPAMAQVVDYAHHRLKSARLDVVLCAKARFILGNTSGISLVGTVFGTPCALANMVPVTALGVGPRDLSIPKLHRLTREARYLRFDEIFAMPVAKAQYPRVFAEAGVEVEENVPEDILGLVADMFDQLEGRADAVPGARELQQAFLAMMRPDQYSFGAASNVGARFLARHRDLLPAR
jgi:putative glycosyltransferase (TIGR04372 family)